jgi:hypothetical protein
VNPETHLDLWLLGSFVAMLVPAVILLVLYGVRTRFWGSATGWAFFWMIVTVVVSTGLSLVSLVWTEWATSTAGYVVRTGSRFAIAAVLWNLLRVFLKAQRSGRLEAEHEAYLHSGEDEDAPEQR